MGLSRFAVSLPRLAKVAHQRFVGVGADFDGTTAYEFSGDGNGVLLLPNVTYDFTYEIKKDQISIDYENESVRDGTYTFRVEEDKLTLIGGEGTAEVGKVYELTLVKEK